MSVYKLYSATIQDAAASVDVISDGMIEGVQWMADADFDADGETLSAELSFSSSSGLTTNDTKSSITGFRQTCGAAGTPANLTVVGINQMIPLPNVAVVEGERLYLHLAGTNGRVTAYVWVNDGLDIAGRQRRVRL
jgi:hypothetical protein